MKQLESTLTHLLQPIYGEQCPALVTRLLDAAEQFAQVRKPAEDTTLTATDMMLITYGDRIHTPGEAPLRTLHNFLKRRVGDALSAVHILPFYPFTSDDGFSVVDYWRIDAELGDWSHIWQLSKDYDLMFDGVVNHISQKSRWFQGYLAGEPEFADFFIDHDPADERLNKVTRPRALPLLTAFDVKDAEGNSRTRHIWTTFSDDQIDLNFASPELFFRICELILFYIEHGARYLRLDAIGFIWKELGTSCIHLPQAHDLIKAWRALIDAVAPDVCLITETNVPHRENISYFGSGDEAHLVYQFPLPPLTLHAFHTGDASHLTRWAADLEPCRHGTTFFNFLASHDGIGMRPIEGLLPPEARDLMVEKCLAHGGRVSYKNNGDGTQSPYELNINYQDALTPLDASDQARTDRFLAAQSILLSLAGVPGIYIHSLLGSRNDYAGLEASGINRRINREKLELDRLETELAAETPRRALFQRYLRLLALRRAEPAFAPHSQQQVLQLDPRVFALLRGEGAEQVLVLINVSGESLTLDTPLKGRDRLTDESCTREVAMKPYQVRWIKAGC